MLRGWWNVKIPLGYAASPFEKEEQRNRYLDGPEYFDISPNIIFDIYDFFKKLLHLYVFFVYYTTLFICDK